MIKMLFDTITPIRLLFGQNKGKQRTILYHLFPSVFKPDSVSS